MEATSILRSLDLEKNGMDLSKILAELKAERAQILERLADIARPNSVPSARRRRRRATEPPFETASVAVPVPRPKPNLPPATAAAVPVPHPKLDDAVAGSGQYRSLTNLRGHCDGRETYPHIKRHADGGPRARHQRGIRGSAPRKTRKDGRFQDSW